MSEISHIPIMIEFFELLMCEFRSLGKETKSGHWPVICYGILVEGVLFQWRGDKGKLEV